MNRYPLWKYILIGASLVIAFIYTLPNFFGDVPAVQVLPLRTTEKVDAALLQRVETALKTAGLANTGVALDPHGVKARFADTDTQIKAKDVLQASLGSSYTVALNLLSASPDWLTSLGALPMNLGLDLRGGVHFLLQVDMPKALDKAAERYQGDIRTLMREKKVRYTAIGREGEQVNLRFRDAEQLAEARRAIEEAYPDLQLVDSPGG
jgi:preprotein translocase subunit SecD